MDAKISDDFWSDPAIEQIEAPQRLTALWLMTNGKRNLAGYQVVSPKRFAFETGLPPEELDRTLEALPRVFERLGDGIWIRNFIRRQFGDGAALKKSYVGKALVRQLKVLGSPSLLSRVLTEYPSLLDLLESAPDEVPTKPLGRDQSKSKSKSKSTEGSAEGNKLDLLTSITRHCSAIFGRKEATLSQSAQFALVDRLTEPTEEGWQAIAAFYGACQADDSQRQKWRPCLSADNLAKNLDGELEKAMQWARETGFSVKNNLAEKPREEPPDAAAWMAENYPDRAGDFSSFWQWPVSVRTEFDLRKETK